MYFSPHVKKFLLIMQAKASPSTKIRESAFFQKISDQIYQSHMPINYFKVYFLLTIISMCPILVIKSKITK